jgi:prevent-host-death family protein
MASYTVVEARNKLPEIIKQAEQGKPVVITRRGVPVAEVVAKRRSPRKRRFGLFSDSAVIDPNWDRPQDDIDAWLAGDV